MLVVTTLSERRLLILFWTELGSLLINVLDFKDFSPFTLSEVAPDLDLLPFSCMLRELLFIGMLERVWRKESSLRLARILLLLRRIMKRSALTLLKVKREKKEKNIR